MDHAPACADRVLACMGNLSACADEAATCADKEPTRLVDPSACADNPTCSMASLLVRITTRHKKIQRIPLCE